MTERTLLVRASFDAQRRYFALAMDVPSVRVFDCATGQLAAIAELPTQNKQFSAAKFHSNRFSSLTGDISATSLTSLALGDLQTASSSTSSLNASKKGAKKSTAPPVLDDKTVVAAGLSDGTLLLHNVISDTHLFHLLLSETQQAIVSVATAGPYVVCLSKDHKIYVVQMETGRVCNPLGLKVGSGASTVAVSRISNQQEGASGKEGEERLAVFVGGSTHALYHVTLLHQQSADLASATAELICSFAAQSSQNSYAWLHPEGHVAVTCSAQEGIIRVWDVKKTVSGPRCRRSLPCGSRVAHVSVNLTADGGEGCLVVGSTFTGQTLVWAWDGGVAPSTYSALPLTPSLRLVAKPGTARFLFAEYAPKSQQVLFVRRSFGLPLFDSRQVTGLLASHRLLSTEPSSSLTAAVPLQDDDTVQGQDDGTTEESAAAVASLDDVWAANAAMATRAMLAGREEFTTPSTYHAPSVAALPSDSFQSLEDRQRRMQSTTTTSSSSKATKTQGLGVSTVPVYQALHAGDHGMLMDLLTVAARSQENFLQLIRALQLPYVLQVLKLLSERIQTSSTRSPLFQWVSWIIAERGGELYALSAEQRSAKKVHEAPAAEAKATNAPDSLLNTSSSSPEVFVAPILSKFRQMTSTYDRLSYLYGRLSIFKSVRPRETRVARQRVTETTQQQQHVDANSTVVFPATFEEVFHAKTQQYRFVRSRSESAASGKKKAKRTSFEDMRLSDSSDDDEDDDEDDDDLSLNSDEMEDMLASGDMTSLSTKPKAKKRSKTEVALLADIDHPDQEGAAGGEDEEGREAGGSDGELSDAVHSDDDPLLPSDNDDDDEEDEEGDEEGGEDDDDDGFFDANSDDDDDEDDEEPDDEEVIAPKKKQSNERRLRAE